MQLTAFKRGTVSTTKPACKYEQARKTVLIIPPVVMNKYEHRLRGPKMSLETCAGQRHMDG